MRGFVARFVFGLRLPAFSETRYHSPPKEILDMLHAPIVFDAVISPTHDEMPLATPQCYPSIAYFAESMLQLAGVRTWCAVRWPRSWMGWKKELPPGERVVANLWSFIEQLAFSILSSKTISRPLDDLWMLGGQITCDLNKDPPLRKCVAERIPYNAVNEDGEPLIHNGSEEEQRSLDPTCRKVRRFLTQYRPGLLAMKFPHEQVIGGVEDSIDAQES